MRSNRERALVVSLLAHASLLTACGDEETAVAFVERKARELRPETLAGKAHLLESSPAKPLPNGCELSWHLATDLSWSEYARTVKRSLGARMQVTKDTDGVLVLRDAQPGDVYQLELCPGRPATEAG